MKVVDITKYLDERGKISWGIPDKARHLISFLAELIKETTYLLPKKEWQTKEECFTKDCQCRIVTSFVDNMIHWYCSECGRKGLISNWQHTKWNYENLQLADEDEEIMEEFFANSLSEKNKKGLLR